MICVNNDYHKTFLILIYDLIKLCVNFGCTDVHEIAPHVQSPLTLAQRGGRAALEDAMPKVD